MSHLLCARRRIRAEDKAYFRYSLLSQNLYLRNVDDENVSVVEWQLSKFLVSKMENIQLLGRNDLDESEILMRSIQQPSI